MSTTGNVLIGVLAGVAAGALLGILFAPDKGSVTRRKIAKKGEDCADAVKEKFNDFIENVSEKYDNVKEGVSAFAEKQKVKSEKA
jgi:gas vesicle protein